MGHKMGHVKKRIVLAKLVEIQHRDPVAVDDNMVRREVTVRGNGRPARQGRTSPLNARQNVAEKAGAPGIDLRKRAVPSSQRMEVTTESISATTAETARMQLEQPSGSRFECAGRFRLSEEETAKRLAFRPVQDQNFPLRHIAKRLREGPWCAGEAMRSQSLQGLKGLRSMIARVQFGNDAPAPGIGPFPPANPKLDLDDISLARYIAMDIHAAGEDPRTVLRRIEQQRNQDLDQTPRFPQQGGARYGRVARNRGNVSLRVPASGLHDVSC